MGILGMSWQEIVTILLFAVVFGAFIWSRGRGGS